MILRYTQAVCAVAGFLLTATLINSAIAQGFPPANVNIVQAEIRTLSPAAWVSGSVVSRNNSKIAAEISGRLLSLAELGHQVEQGQVIAKIDDTRLQIQKREDAANVENARSHLVFLNSEVKRKQMLVDQKLAAMTDLDETISKRDIAQGEFIAAEARLAKTEQDLSYTELKAPFSGLVAQRLSNIGEYVNNGTAVIRLVETTNLEASVYAPLTAYRFLKQNFSLAVESPLGNAMVPIKSLVPVADGRSHLMEVRLDMSSLDWPVGLNIKAAVANGDSKDALSVPRDALVLRRDGASVFRIDDENKAQQLTVTLGVGAGEYVEIIGDVKAGDKIVVRGAERLRAGQTVNVKNNNKSLISGKQ